MIKICRGRLKDLIQFTNYGCGSGYGYGSGCGYGYGFGDGYGYGSGYGNGYSYGDGNGYRYGDGCGYGPRPSNASDFFNASSNGLEILND